MKQKILFLFTLLLCCCSGVYAQTTLPNGMVLPEGVLLPDNIVDADCFVDPPVQKWKIKEVENSIGALFNPTTITLVGDIDDDGKPDILGIGGGGYEVYIMDGEALTVKKSFTIDVGNPIVNALAAVGKVQWTSGVYKNVVFTLSDSEKKLFAYDTDGNKLWTSDTNFTSDPYDVGACIQLIDLDGDGWVEIVVGNRVFAAESGKLLCSADTGTYNGFIHGWGNGIRNIIQSMAGDILGNGEQQIAVGNKIYGVSISSRTNAGVNTMTAIKTIASPRVWNGTAYETIPSVDGAVQLVDLDLDGSLDMVVNTVIRDETTPANSVFYMYVYSYAKDQIIASKKINTIYKRSVPFIGDIDGDGYPEIVLVHGGIRGNAAHASDAITALQYNPSSTTGELTTFWQIAHDDTSGATGITLFDFNQDGISELVYRDEKYLRIINGSKVHHETKAPNTPPYDLASFVCTSTTGYEYPVIADIDNDGQAEIIVIGNNSYPSVGNGPLRVFKAGDGTSWAPARKVWNQYSYNSVNVNEDLTIPKVQFNPATVFPGRDGILDGDDIRPFNNFLQQQTTLNRNGTPLWLAPNGQITGTPVFSYNADADKMTITLKVHNAGDAIFQNPFYVTVYKDIVGGAISETYKYSNTIAIGETATITFTIDDFKTDGWVPYNFLLLKINDNGDGTNNQDVCDDSDSQYRYRGILPTEQDVCLGKVGEMTCCFTLGNDSYQWQSSKDGVTWIPIPDASDQNTYTPTNQRQGTTFYRVVVTNTVTKEEVASEPSKIRVRSCKLPVNHNISVMGYYD